MRQMQNKIKAEILLASLGDSVGLLVPHRVVPTGLAFVC